MASFRVAYVILAISFCLDGVSLARILGTSVVSGTATALVLATGGRRYSATLTSGRVYAQATVLPFPARELRSALPMVRISPM